MNTKDIFINFREGHTKLAKNIGFFQEQNIRMRKYKKQYVKLENEASQEQTTKDDYDFICEYSEMLVLNSNKSRKQ